ncbi:C40 family peptidase [Streptomyces pactum]|uniref:C40 family peptidase n=1 Tax=Streptomyces pactum TaxID=68249 RepID=A0ABS0NE54_9ACTN|nr:C40 family peptidase [Streptomyces pactum]MBH5333446.1 C40 family peptidase [Streptomyces pactum]
MSAIPSIPTSMSRAGAVAALAAATMTASLLVPGAAAEAEAATPAAKALKVAAAKKGSPYRYGAAGPNRFDCSGLTLYAYKKAGKSLPRTAAAQYNRTRHVSAKSRKPGDLVFFHSGGQVYHVGIYAGKNQVWHSPKPGKSVRKEKIWTGKVRYGRVK